MSTINSILAFIIDHWSSGLMISSILYEIIARIKPTNKDWSILNKIVSILDIIIPNLEKDKTTGKIKMKKRANIIKCILIFFVFGASLNANAQINQNAKAYYSYNVSDTAFVQNTRATKQTLEGNTGVIYFDEIRNKWRAWDGSGYVDLIPNTSGGGLVSAINGLSVDGTAVELGGELIQSTTIDGNNSYAISFTDISDFDVTGNSVNITSGISGTSLITDTNGSITLSSGGTEFIEYSAFAPNRPALDFGGNDGIMTYTPAGSLSIFPNGGSGGSIGIGFDATGAVPAVSDDVGIFANSTIQANIGVNPLMILSATDISFDSPGTVDFTSISSSTFNSGDALTLQSTGVFGIISGGDLSVQRISGGGFTANTSTGLNLFAASGLTVRSTSRHTFTATSTLPGINIGSFAGDPSTLVNADFWYNSTAGAVKMRIGGATSYLTHIAAPTSTRIPFFSGNEGLMTNDADLTFTTASNRLNTGDLAISSLASTAGIIYNNVSSVDNEAEFTYNPTDNIIALTSTTGGLNQTNTGNTLLSELDYNSLELSDVAATYQLAISAGTGDATIALSGASADDLTISAPGNTDITAGVAMNLTSGGGTNIVTTAGQIVLDPDDGAPSNVIVGSDGDNLWVNGGVENSSASGMKHQRVSTGSLAGSTSSLVTLTWGTPFADANYTCTCSVIDATAATASLSIVHIETQTATAVAVRINNASGGNITGTLQCIAMHD